MSVTVTINNSVWIWLKDYLERHAVMYRVEASSPTEVLKPTSNPSSEAK